MLPGMFIGPGMAAGKILSIDEITGAAYSGANPSYPALQAGDLVLAWTYGGTAWNSPAGWTLASAYVRGVVALKIAVGSETGSISLTTATPTRAGITIFRANVPIKTASFASYDEDYAGGFGGVSVAMDGTANGTQPKILVSTHMGSSQTDNDSWSTGSPETLDYSSTNAMKWQGFIGGATDISVTATQADSGTWTYSHGLIVEMT